MKILALDLASESCSAALWQDGALTGREAPAARGHGGQLLLMVDALLDESATALAALDAIAFGRGPGAFTGLRLAASVTQGLAFAAGLPVIPVSDLRAMAQQLMTPPDPAARVLVCHDARMGEVYWAGFASIEGCAVEDTAEAVAITSSWMRRWWSCSAKRCGNISPNSPRVSCEFYERRDFRSGERAR